VINDLYIGGDEQLEEVEFLEELISFSSGQKPFDALIALLLLSSLLSRRVSDCVIALRNMSLLRCTGYKV
jgi:hypothetical protein